MLLGSQPRLLGASFPREDVPYQPRDPALHLQMSDDLSLEGNIPNNRLTRFVVCCCFIRPQFVIGLPSLPKLRIKIQHKRHSFGKLISCITD